VVGLLVATYFLGFFTIAGTAYLIGGYAPSQKGSVGLCILACVCLMGTPSAYGEPLQPKRMDVGALVVHRTLRDRLLFRRHLGSLAEHSFEIGRSGTRFTDKGPMHLVFANMHLAFARQSDSILVTAHIYDKTGKTIAVIEDGQWRTPENDDVDFNYSDDALEVKSASGRIVLQIRLLPDRIQVQVEAWNPVSRRGVRIGAQRNPKTGSFSGAGAFVKILTLKSDPDEPHIEPLFLYPSKLNLGRYVNRPPQFGSDNEAMLPVALVCAIVIFGCVLLVFAIRRRRRIVE
jgi:hypothetical protein